MLGKAQWAWLESALQQPADLRLIVTSIQFLNPGNGWEAWSTMPLERDRLIALIKKYQVQNVIFISGDRHYGEISKYEASGVPTFYDFTSSGLTHGKFYGMWEKNPYRMGKTSIKNNYGLIQVDWENKSVTLSLYDSKKGLVNTQEIELK